MSKKHKRSYTKHLLSLASAVTGYVTISPVGSSVGIPTGITRSAVGIKICVITAGIKNFKSIINKTKKKHSKIALFAKTKLNSIKALILKALMDSKYISHDETVSVNVLREYDIYEEIKNLKTSAVYQMS